MVAANLINSARSRLGDLKKQRWDDVRLMQILNQGQADICKLTGIYRKEALLALGVGQTRYILPLDCMTIRRLEYQGKPVDLFSRDDLDEGKQASGDFVGLKDNIAMGNLDIYPPLSELTTNLVLVVEGTKLDNTYEIVPQYGVVTRTEEPLNLETPYGVITGLNYTPIDTDTPTIYGEVVRTPLDKPVQIQTNSDYGVLTGVSTLVSKNEDLFGFITDSDIYKVSGKYGITTDIIPESNTLKIYYEAVPTTLTDQGATLFIPDMWEEAMERYIVGTALQDDNDANNIQRGEMELQKYSAEVLKARELASKDFSGGTKAKYETRYRRI